VCLCLFNRSFIGGYRKTTVSVLKIPQDKGDFTMNIPGDFKYTVNDEYIQVDGDTGIVGISDYAQDQLSDIVFVEILVAVGDEVEKGSNCATVESVKAAAEVYFPVSGVVLEINENLSGTPELINSDPYGEAWMVKIKITSPEELDELMDGASYEAHIQEK
jgi:glycine cleavage system H protein